ncbi:hypothetical protein I5501_16390 [Citrobacter freundii]|nr:hypothetical protein [Citrobacter freundii]MBK2670437.1 hypothetical protein [Citrobacter freundii]UJB73738.1 hypothetical protein HRV88_01385 [Citrobacter portucalensis]
MVGWTVASQDAPVSNEAGRTNSVQPATQRLVPSVAVNFTHWRLPYGYYPSLFILFIYPSL